MQNRGAGGRTTGPGSVQPASRIPAYSRVHRANNDRTRAESISPGHYPGNAVVPAALVVASAEHGTRVSRQGGNTTVFTRGRSRKGWRRARERREKASSPPPPPPLSLIRHRYTAPAVPVAPGERTVTISRVTRARRWRRRRLRQQEDILRPVDDGCGFWHPGADQETRP